MRRAGFTTDGKSPAFCAMQGEPHGGERPDMDVRAGPQRGRSRSVAGKSAERFARSLHGRIHGGPGHDWFDHPSGRFIFLRNALYRGSPSRLLNGGSPLMWYRPVFLEAYERSSHFNASSDSPRNA